MGRTTVAAETHVTLLNGDGARIVGVRDGEFVVHKDGSRPMDVMMLDENYIRACLGLDDPRELRRRVDPSVKVRSRSQADMSPDEVAAIYRKTAGASRAGIVKVAFEELVEAFGEPFAGPDGASVDGKVTCKFVVEFADGVVATVYDYHPCEEEGLKPTARGVLAWHVGGHDSRALAAVAAALGCEGVADEDVGYGRGYYNEGDDASW